jgi:LAO/AO transport system kinase
VIRTSDLLEGVLRGEPRAVGRAMRLADDDVYGAHELLKVIWPHTGKAWVLGVTGNPGAGKSTLCDRLIAAYRARGHRVGVVAVDPSSPYSGGAILGDRIRMARHATDDGVFIRSLATRGHLGGLTRSARDVVRVLDAAGYGIVIVETVGVGQDELEITLTAHSTLVVMAPGMGDEVQAIKAGLLECADVFVVNKADRDGAEATVRDLELMISLGNRGLGGLPQPLGQAAHGSGHGFVQDAMTEPVAGAPSESWTPPITKCVAATGDGVPDVVSSLDLAEQVRESLRDSLIEAAVHDLGPELDEATLAVDAGSIDPYTAVERLVAAFRARS